MEDETFEKQIKQIKQEAKKIHQQTHNIIYGREDIERPLSFDEEKKFAELSLRHEELQRKIKTLEFQITKQRIYQLDFDNIKLTTNERTILSILAKTNMTGMTSKDIAERLRGIKHKRRMIHDNLRKFKIAGFVLHDEDNYLYRITPKGSMFYEHQIKML